jgi:hypothetical protein
LQIAHIEGSRKQKVHALFDKEGAAPAFTLGTKLGLQASSLHTWFSKWRAEDVKAALAKNAKAKAKAKKATKVKPAQAA